MRRPLPYRIAVIGLLALAVPAPRAHATGFESLGPDGGRVDAFVQSPSNPDRLFCLPYRQGVFRSDDHGASWQRVDTGIPFDTTLQQAAVSPANQDIVLVGDPAGDRLLRSTDGGVTWAPISIATGWNFIEAIAFDPHDPSVALAAIRDGAQSGMRRSTDAGLTWVPSGTGMSSPDPNSIAFHPGLAGIVLCANSDGVFRSTNGGVTWTLVRAGWALSPSFSSGSRAWALVGNVIVRSDDNGATFTAVAQPGSNPAQSFSVLAGSPTDPNAVVVGQISWICGGDCYSSLAGVIRSSNGGVSWAGTNYDPQHETWKNQRFDMIAFDVSVANAVWMTITNDDSSVDARGLSRSTNGGNTFALAMNGIAAQSIMAVDRDNAGTVYARRDGEHGFWSSTAVGNPWVERASSDISFPTCFEAIRRAPGILVEAGYQPSMDTADPLFSTTTNGGQAWYTGDPPRESLFSIPNLVRSNHAASGMTYLWIEEFGGWLLCRTDAHPGGPFFSSLPAFPTAGAAIDPSDDSRLFAVDRSTGEVKLSTNAGAAWTTRSIGLPNATPIDLFLDPSNSARLAVVYQTAGAYRSDDGGLSWSGISATQVAVPAVSADWDPALDRLAIVTQANGVYVTGRGLVTDGLTTRELTDVVFEPVSEKVLIGSRHAGVFGLDVPDPTAAPEVATVAALQLQTHPNPFRRDIAIRLSTPVGRSVALEVVAVDGRRVADLYRGVSMSTSLDVSWNGRDASNAEVAPGVYFVRARVGDETTSSRIVRVDREE